MTKNFPKHTVLMYKNGVKPLIFINTSTEFVPRDHVFPYSKRQVKGKRGHVVQNSRLPFFTVKVTLNFSKANFTLKAKKNGVIKTLTVLREAEVMNVNVTSL